MKSSLGLLPHGFRARWSGLSRLALSAFLALSACGTTRHSTQPVSEPVTAEPIQSSRSDTVPEWIAAPLSWEKLGAVETWLDIDGRTAAPEWRIEGELVLNLGRLEFARREAGQKNETTPALASRVRTARAGLEHALADIDATSVQRKRATDGIARAERLLAQGTATKTASLALITRKAWGAAPAHPERMDRTQGPYTRITVHHSADPDPVALDGTSSKTFEAVREIQKAHMDGKTTHYGDIGYHFVIDPFGRVLEGRELAYQGAHAYGDNNISNIGICLIGNFDEEQPTKAALDALRRMLDHMRKTYSIPKNKVYGHRELRKTECPGDNLMRWLEGYRK